MTRTKLHLVDKHGNTISSVNRAAAEAAFAWAEREFPQIDPALVADWAEEVGKTIETYGQRVESPKRYAFAALHGKVRQWMRSKASKEIPVGIGVDLEKWVGVENGIQRMMDRTILFNELKAKLNERDNFILMLLVQDISTPAGVAEALGVSYAAAAQAIHRVKNRIAASMAQSEIEEPESDRYCRVKG